jgi:large subunit ribosomal protein L13
MKTYSPRPRDIERRWYVIDASGAVLGRLSSEVAAILRGKHKPIFAPHLDTGDHVIVVNAKGVQLTGDKDKTKVAYRHSGYPGGLTATSYGRLLETRPAFAVEKAVRGMLPKNRLGRAMFKKLQVYAGPEHPHQAQRPQPLRLGEVPTWEGLPAPKETPARPEPTAAAAPAARRTPAKRTSTKPAATKSPAKRTTAKRTTAKRTTTKAPAAAPSATSTAKRTAARRTKKEE